MNQATETTGLAPATNAFTSLRRLAALRRFGKLLNTGVSRIAQRGRRVDISIVMLIFGLLVALAVVLGLALDPVARRH